MGEEGENTLTTGGSLGLKEEVKGEKDFETDRR